MVPSFQILGYLLISQDHNVLCYHFKNGLDQFGVLLIQPGYSNFLLLHTFRTRDDHLVVMGFEVCRAAGCRPEQLPFTWSSFQIIPTPYRGV